MSGPHEPGSPQQPAAESADLLADSWNRPVPDRGSSGINSLGAWFDGWMEAGLEKPAFRNRLAFVPLALLATLMPFMLDIPSPVALSVSSLHGAARILLGVPVGVVFIPFLAYAVFALWLFLKDPQRYGRPAWVRWGLYTGAGISLHYLILLRIERSGAQEVLSWEIVLLIPLHLLLGLCLPLLIYFTTRPIVRAFRTLSGRCTDRQLGLLLLLLLPFLPLVVMPIAAAAYGVLLILIYSGVVWALAGFLLLSLYTIRRFGGRGQFQLKKLFLMVSFLGVYFCAWRIALLWMRRL